MQKNKAYFGRTGEENTEDINNRYLRVYKGLAVFKIVVWRKNKWHYSNYGHQVK